MRDEKRTHIMNFLQTREDSLKSVQFLRTGVPLILVRERCKVRDITSCTANILSTAQTCTALSNSTVDPYRDSTRAIRGAV